MYKNAWRVASRGRDPLNPSDRTPGIHLEQRLEINRTNTCNCITSVAKDSYVLEEKNDMTDSVDNYRVRKLTPREAMRLMDFTDEQFDAAAEVASNTALYKASGNSIVVNCLTAIIGQMIEGREDYYKRGYVDNSVDKVEKIKDE